MREPPTDLAVASSPGPKDTSPRFPLSLSRAYPNESTRNEPRQCIRESGGQYPWPMAVRRGHRHPSCSVVGGVAGESATPTGGRSGLARLAVRCGPAIDPTHPVDGGLGEVGPGARLP